MINKETQKFVKRGGIHGAIRGWQIGQAIAPVVRLATPDLKRNKVTEVIDVARILIGARAVWKMSEMVPTREILGNVKNVLTEDVRIGPLKLPAGVFAGVAAAGSIAIIESLVRLEKDREKTALTSAPVEAQKIRSAYDGQVNQTKEIKVDGKKVAVNGAQALAYEYAGKTLAEAEQKHGKKKVQAAVKAAEVLIGVAYDPSNPNVALQTAILAVAGDAYESILLEKEVRETAAALTKRPQDVLINGGRELARKAAKGIERVERVWVVGNLVQTLTPKFVDRAISTLAGDKPVAAGNLTLDPRVFINAGSEKTQAMVREELEKHFSEFIAAEQAVDATGVQIRLLNDQLPTGVKLSETEKDGLMNVILGSVLIRLKPDMTPTVAGITGVMDTYQNNPVVLGSEFAPKEKNRRRKS